MKRGLQFLAVLLSLPVFIYAQVSGYSHTSSSGTYTAISTGLLLGDASTDDQRFVDSTALAGGTTNMGNGFSIGFNFNYGGAVYDKVGVNANGWIGLGSGTVNIAATTSPISSSTSSYVLAPFGRDLQSRTGGELRIASIGIAPNRQLVVQWTNYKRFGTTYSSDTLNFQVILNENGSIDFIYGYCNTSATSTFADPQVGLKGASTADYHNLDGTFAALTSGTSSAANVDFDNTTAPSSGQTITFSAPSCFAPSALGVSNLSTTTVDIYWTTGGAANWNVEYGASGFTLGTGTAVVASNDTLAISGLSVNTTYDFYVKDSCGLGDVSAFAGPFSFTTLCSAIATFPATQDFEGATTGNPGTLPNCWSMGNTSTYRWQVDNATTSSSNTGPATDNTLGTTAGIYVYTEASNGLGGDIAYLNSPLYDVTSLTNPQLQFYYHMYGTFITRLQVEAWNTTTLAWDSVYAISGQQQTASSDPWEKATVNLTAYKSAELKLRFWSMKSTATGNTYEGDVAIDDITVRETPNCIAPTAQGATNLTSTSADLYWTTGGAANWNVEYGPTGFTPGTGTMVNAANDTLSITGLTALTDYEFYVRDSCGVGSVSSWVGPTSFMTPCASMLSGTYTVDNGMPTAGTNYNTLAEAVSNLTMCGVSGAVIFNIKEGTYNESIVLDSIAGASSSNTVVFQADASNTNPVIVTDSSTSSADNFVVHFNNTDWVTLDGITVSGTGASYSRAIEFSGSNSNITIQNCILNALETGSTSTNHAVVYDNTGTSNMSHNITISGNTINNGSYGVYLYGGSSSSAETGHIVSGNTIQNFYYYGIRCYYQDGATLSGNIITSSVMAAFSTVYGIYNGYSDNSSVIENQITVHGSSTNYGIYNYYCDATALAPNLIANNMVTCSDNSGSTYGIYPFNNYYTDVVFNSVNITDGGSTTGRALYINSSSTGTYGFINIFNNNLVNTGGGYAAEITNNAVTLGYVDSSDFNNMYVTGTDLIEVGSTSYTDLASYQAAISFDANSVSADPLFTAPDDLHVASPALDGAGTPFGGVVTDIDGDPRGAMPDIGADEFTAPSCLPASGLATVMIYSDSAVVSWTSSGATSYNLEFDTTGFTLGNGTSITGVVDTFYTITGLTPQVAYDFYVQSDCGLSGTSPWAGPLTFTTACAAFSSFPWVEDFETSQNSIPSCWENEVGDDSDWIFRNGSIGHGSTTDNTLGTSAGHYAGVDDSHSNSNDTVNNLLTPSFDLTSLTTPRLNFHYFIGNDNVLTSTLYIDVYDGSAWNTSVAKIEFTQAAWLQYFVDLTPYKSAGSQIRFRVHETTDFNSDVSIDDVIVEETPPCPIPTFLAVDSITSFAAKVKWVSSPGATNSFVEYGLSGFTAGNGTVVSTPNDSIVISGLLANTAYDVCVYDSCGAFVSGRVCETFITMPSPVSVPYNEDFEGASNAMGISSGGDASAMVDTFGCASTNAILFTGGSASGWSGGSTSTTATQAWDQNTTKHGQALLLVDATPVSGLLYLDFDLRQQYSFGALYNWFRVLINDTAQVTPDYHAASSTGDTCSRITIDLSAYAGTVFSIKFQAANKYAIGTGTGNGDNSFLDNVSIYSPVVVGCAPFASNAVNDSLCVPGATGFTTTTGSYLGLLDATGNIIQAGAPLSFFTNKDTTVSVTEVVPDPSNSGHVGPLTSIAPAGFGNFSNGQYINVVDTIRIDSMTVRANGAVTAQLVINNAANTTVLQRGAEFTTGSATADYQVEVGVVLTPGVYFMNVSFISGAGQLFRASSGASYPYTLPGLMSIDSTNFSSQVRIYYTFDLVATKVCLGTPTSATAYIVGQPAGEDASVVLCDNGATMDLTTSLSASAAAGGTFSSTNGAAALSGSMFNPALVTPGTYDVLYVTSSVGTCQADSAIITVLVQNCSGCASLVAPVATNDTLCGPGLATLTAVGDNLVWYNPADSTLFGGSTFEDSVTATTTYNVRSVFSAGPAITVGASVSTNSNAYPSGNFTNGQYITVSKTVRIDSATFAVNGPLDFVVAIQDVQKTDTLQFSQVISYTSADTAAMEIGVVLSPGTYFMNTIPLSGTGVLYRMAAGAAFPYGVPGYFTADSSDFGPSRYYYFHDMKVSSACLSPAVQAMAVVTGGTLNAGMNNSDTICDSVVPVDVSTYLGAGVTPGGNWIDVNSSGGLTGNMFDPSAVATGQTYILRYVVSNSCGTDSAEVSLYVEDCGIGLKDYFAGRLQLYPNPAQDYLDVEMIGEKLRNATVGVYSINGQLLISKYVESEKVVRLDMTTLPKGVYTIKVSSEQGSGAYQITKM